MAEEATKTYDVVVIGTGPAGLTAALYASRANLKTAVLDLGAPGGELLNTAEVENYPGFKDISGSDLAMAMYDSAMQFGAEYLYGNVSGIETHDNYHIVKTDNGTYETKSVVIATGSTHRNLGAPGEDEYQGRGVSYCAVCDGAFFKNKNVVVVGGGNAAVEEGTYLSQLAGHVNIIHRRDQLRAEKILQDRAFAKDNIDFTWDTVVEEIKGDGQKVTGVVTKNVKTGETTEVPADGVFVYVGLVPNSEAFTDLGITDERGWIEADETMATRVPGIFVAGDVRQKHLRQISTAIGDGGIAGQSVYDYVTALEG